eukprot:1155993-Pelagomonas_calceolata.AAC.6
MSGYVVCCLTSGPPSQVHEQRILQQGIFPFRGRVSERTQHEQAMSCCSNNTPYNMKKLELHEPPIFKGSVSDWTEMG